MKCIFMIIHDGANLELKLLIFLQAWASPELFLGKEGDYLDALLLILKKQYQKSFHQKVGGNLKCLTNMLLKAHSAFQP